MRSDPSGKRQRSGFRQLSAVASGVVRSSPGPSGNVVPGSLRLALVQGACLHTMLILGLVPAAWDAGLAGSGVLDQVPVCWMKEVLVGVTFGNDLLVVSYLTGARYHCVLLCEVSPESLLS